MASRSTTFSAARHHAFHCRSANLDTEHAGRGLAGRTIEAPAACCVSAVGSSKSRQTGKHHAYLPGVARAAPRWSKIIVHYRLSAMTWRQKFSRQLGPCARGVWRLCCRMLKSEDRQLRSAVWENLRRPAAFRERRSRKQRKNNPTERLRHPRHNHRETHHKNKR